MLLRSFLCVAVVLGVAAVASAEPIGFLVSLRYQTSYDSLGTDVGTLTNTQVAGPNGTLHTAVNLTTNPLGAEYHAFKVLLTTFGLAAAQDAQYFQYFGTASGGVTLDDGGIQGGFYAASELSGTSVNPPRMPGSTTTTGSDAPNAVPWGTNQAAGWSTLTNTAFAHEVLTGVNNNNYYQDTFGDYAAFIHVGEGSNAAYDIGTLVLHASAQGTYGMSFDPAGGSFMVINDNGGTNGSLTPANRMGMGKTTVETAGYEGRADSIQFIVLIPEPGTFILLATGLLGLLAYAWRKRK